MKPLQKFLPLLLFALLLAALITGLLRHDSNAPRFAQHVGESVPPTKLGNFDPAQLKGQTYLVNFFAAWCEACRAEHEELQNLAAQGLKIIGIVYKDKPEMIHKFLEKSGSNPYAQLAYDNEGRFALDWGLTGVPESFLIDAEGKISRHIVGPVTEDQVPASP